MRDEIDAKRRKLIETVKDQTPIHPAWLAACINQVKSEDAIIVSELGAPLPLLEPDQADDLSWAGCCRAGWASAWAPASAPSSRRPSAR